MPDHIGLPIDFPAEILPARNLVRVAPATNFVGGAVSLAMISWRVSSLTVSSISLKPFSVMSAQICLDKPVAIRSICSVTAMIRVATSAR